jgi:hypothetical protein
VKSGIVLLQMAVELGAEEPTKKNTHLIKIDVYINN